MNNKKKVALVAHDNMKRDLAEWVDWNWEVLLKHHLICTGTTGKMVEKTLRDRRGREFREDDVDVKALLRIATLYNVPTAIDRSSADFLISSPLFGSDYTPVVKDYKSYVERTLNG